MLIVLYRPNNRQLIYTPPSSNPQRYIKATCSRPYIPPTYKYINHNPPP